MTDRSTDLIVAPLGTKVRLKPDLCEDRWFDKERALGFDKVFTIVQVDVDKFSSTIYFEEIEKGFNPSAFEPLEDFEPISEEEWAVRFKYYCGKA